MTRWVWTILKNFASYETTPTGMRLILTLTVLSLVLSSCVYMMPTANKMNRLQVGMTKPQVGEALGAPATTSALVGREYWTYAFMRPNRRSREYKVVVFDDGRVTGWGSPSAFPMRSSTNDERPHRHGQKVSPEDEGIPSYRL